MLLETTKIVSCDIDIDQVIEDYKINRFTKYYELQQIALKVLHSNWQVVSSDNIDSLVAQLVSQLAIKLKAMKDTPVSMKDLQYAWETKQDLDYGKYSYTVVIAEIANTTLTEDRVIIDAKYILHKIEPKSVEQQIMEKNTPSIFGRSIFDCSEVLAQSDISNSALGTQVLPTQITTEQKVDNITDSTSNKGLIPEEKEDYDPFEDILCPKN